MYGVRSLNRTLISRDTHKLPVPRLTIWQPFNSWEFWYNIAGSLANLLLTTLGCRRLIALAMRLRDARTPTSRVVNNQNELQLDYQNRGPQTYLCSVHAYSSNQVGDHFVC